MISSVFDTVAHDTLLAKLGDNNVGDKPTHCDKKFTQKGNLKTNKQLHNGDR